jgi:hypothetical protein
VGDLANFTSCAGTRPVSDQESSFRLHAELEHFCHNQMDVEAASPLLNCAPSRTRTDTGRILSPLPLPIGLWGPGGECSARKPVPGHRIPLKIGQIPDVRPVRASSSIRAPRAPSPCCRLSPGDTGMSLDRSLLKLLTPALRSRKRLSPEPFRSRLWTAGSLALRQYTAARTPT